MKSMRWRLRDQSIVNRAFLAQAHDEPFPNCFSIFTARSTADFLRSDGRLVRLAACDAVLRKRGY
jgi:hypothetical protein